MSASTTTAVELRGLDDFAGAIMTGADVVLARLDHVDARRVALVGDPATVAGLVGRMAPRAALLKVFQSEAVWVLPRLAAPRGPLTGVARTIVPSALRRRITSDLATRHLERGVGDGWTRRQLTPTHPPSRHNVVYSDRYHRSLRRADVELVTWPIAGVVADGIRTADGLEHHVDVIAVV